MKHTLSRLCLAMSSLTLAVGLLASVPLSVLAANTSNNRADAFRNAAREFGVPQNLLLAVSYNESRWDTHNNTASVTGGYGVMNLSVHADGAFDGRGDDSRPVTKKQDERAIDTLQKAATLTGQRVEVLKTDTTQNIRGGAAVLAQYAKDTNNGTLPKNINDWYTAVVRYTGSSTAAGQEFADNVYDTLSTGAARQTQDGQLVSLPADKKISPNKHGVITTMLGGQGGGQQNGTDCPSDLNCRFIQAGYAANSTDPADYGNFDPANRPKDMKIKYIIIHDTEGSYESAIDHFQDTTSYVSANYVIRSSDGAITEMVRPKDVSWGAGSWYVNMHAINIEHEGFANDGAGWYTEAMYRSSAKLVRYLAKKYDIPLDRQHILGHDEITKNKPASVINSHWDPGAYWDWNHYMELLTGKQQDRQSGLDLPFTTAKAVQINPSFEANKQVVTDCSGGTCQTLPAQGSNFVYLRTAPNSTAPLLTNTYLHPDGSAGTTEHDDWSAKATTGQRFSVAKTYGDWVGIWYNGTIGWFNNQNRQAAQPVRGTVATATLGTVNVYGSAFPEAGAYPSGVKPASMDVLYTIPKGQSYVILDKHTPTDYFYDATINSSKPYDHEIFHGTDSYYPIMFNHRVGYVKTSDVQLHR